MMVVSILGTGRIVNMVRSAPECEDCQWLAQETGVPLATIIEEVKRVLNF